METSDMDPAAMEELIQDTSYRAVDVTEQYRDCTERPCLGNGCNKTFSTFDEKASPFLNYCADCTSNMRSGFKEIGIVLMLQMLIAKLACVDEDLDEESNEKINDNDSHFDALQHDQEFNENNEPQEKKAADYTLLELCGLFEGLSRSNNTETILNCDLNNKTESFVLSRDFVNGSKFKKLFKRIGIDIPELYWYKSYGAMINVDKFFITPCGFTGTDYVLVSIFETRCNRPHWDALLYNKSTREVTIRRNASRWIKMCTCDLSIEFDDNDMRK
jgi:hypothetical protein